MNHRKDSTWLFSILRRFLLLAILLFAVGFCWYNRTTLIQATELSASQWLWVLGGYLGCYWLNALMACLVQWRRGTNPGLTEMMVINSYASILGYATVLRAGYYSSKIWFYQQRFGLATSTSLGLQGWVSLLVLGGNAGFALLLGFWLQVTQRASLPWVYWALVLGTMVLVVGLLLGLFQIVEQRWVPVRVQKWLFNIKAVVIATNGWEIWQLIFLAMLNVPLQALVFGVLCQVFALPIPISYLLMMAVIANLSLVIALTPANLGVRELVLWQLLRNLDLDNTTLLGVMMVDRVVQFAVLTVICMLGYRLLQVDKR